MAFTPTDPTQAEVRVVQNGAQLGFDFYIPRGAKGEAGGFTEGADLGSTHLDSILVPGLYKQANSSLVTAQNGYPANFASRTGNLMVIAALGAHYTQMWYPVSAAGSNMFYQRAKVGAGAWSAWRTYSGGRVDQTAGRAIYQWDDVNLREQLVYGDTGLRDVSSDAAWTSALYVAGSVDGTGICFLRRVGYEVELTIGFTKTGSGTITTAAGFPAGFRPAGRIHGVGSNSSMIFGRFYNGGGGSAPIWNSTATATNSVVSVMYTTTDAWPATLPGSASGSIPNA